MAGPKLRSELGTAARPGPAVLFARQSWALLRKNLLIRLRSWKLNLLHAFQSIAVVFLIWAIDQAVTYSNSQFTGAAAVRTPAAKDIPQIPDCRNDLFLLRDQPCYAFIYTPNNSAVVDELIKSVRLSNSPPVPQDQVMAMSSPDEVDSYLWQHPQTVLAAVHLTLENGQPTSYILQTNASTTYFKGSFQDPNLYIQLPLQAAVERAVAALNFAALGADSVGWSVRIKDFPHPSLSTESVAGRVAPVFILASLMFNFVVLLSALVTEKENGMRSAMSVMGMMDSAYWLSWVVPELLMGVLHAALITGMARACQFQMVISNDFVLMLLLVFLVNSALMAFGCAVSTCIHKEAMAVPLSFTIFIIAWVLQLVVYFGFPYNSASAAGAALTVLFSFFPWTLLSKGMLDLAAATTGSWREGITWDTRSSYCWLSTPPPSVTGQQLQYWQGNCRMPLGQIYWVLLIQAGAYMLLAFYLDNVLPGGDSPARRPWYFLLTRTFWWPPKNQDLRHVRKALATASASASTDLTHAADTGQNTGATGPLPTDDDNAVDGDVAAEAEVVQRLCRGCFAGSGLGSGDGTAAAGTQRLPLALASGVHLIGLRKVYAPTSWPGLPRWDWDWSARLTACLCLCRHHRPADPGASAASPAQGSAEGRPGHHGGQGAPQGEEAGQGGRSPGPGQGPPGGSSGRRGQRGHVAVANTWLSIPEGQCFALLGPNGAGKTTTIKCLNGALKPSGGDALVYGQSIRSAAGMSAARAMTGVCPQFDVLWGELTAQEHLMLYADIKGLPWASREVQATQLLQQVALQASARARTGTFSGGMRRRLSVAIALLGDPKVIYLDEPTTGMDPVSRRQVWDLLDAAKRERVMVLTTHSMEEADVLGDRIGIFAAGQLRCLGTSLRLKTKYGSGYRVSVLLQQQQQHTSSNPSLPAHTDTSTSGAPQLEAQVQPEGADSAETRLRLLPFGIPSDLAAVIEQHLGQDVLSTGASMQRTANDKLAPTSAAGGQGGDGGAAAAAARYLNIVVPQNQDRQLLSFLNVLHNQAERLGVVDVQIGLTPLEEVYLHVVQDGVKVPNPSTTEG